jgi:hypothetical protein
MTLNNYRNAVLALGGLAMLATTARPAEAQLPRFHPTFYGSAEADTRHSQFYLLGMYVGVGGLGWSPYFNVNAYSLNYRLVPDVASSDRTLNAVLPTLGMAYAGRRRGLSLGVGYAWVSDEDPGAPGAEGGGSDGVTASLGAYHNGTGRRPLHTQLLANYNFDSPYLWARGRASVPFGRIARRAARVGAEVIGQSGGEGGARSNSFQVGPTFEYTWTPRFRTTGVVGYKSVGGPRFGSRESAAYLKLEFSFSP